jgi:aminoglycoside/choline kinase family phosphotransferase
VTQEEIINFAREALALTPKDNLLLTALSGRGSDRLFYRITWGSAGSAILIHYDPIRVENAYYGNIALFLHNIKVPVPRLIQHDANKHLMLMEDLGNSDLWSLRHEPWEIRQDFYKKTLAIVHRLHSFAIGGFPATTVRLTEPFSPELYRWERDYFRDNFVKNVCGMELESVFARKLEAELNYLAQHIHESDCSLVHRDLQSQNVMILVGSPYLIDFQGMRLGSPFYDLGSLLCDPYVQFPEGARLDLLSFYYGLSKKEQEWPYFQQVFWEASVQRLMQALGAYGFLGLKKGLTVFLDHIPAGLANLQRTASHVPTLPYLQELLRNCQKMIEDRWSREINF